LSDGSESEYNENENEEHDVYCYCLGKEKDDMIECCRCANWFHDECQRVIDENFNIHDYSSDDFYCAECQYYECEDNELLDLADDIEIEYVFKIDCTFYPSSKRFQIDIEVKRANLIIEGFYKHIKSIRINNKVANTEIPFSIEISSYEKYNIMELKKPVKKKPEKSKSSQNKNEQENNENSKITFEKELKKKKIKLNKNEQLKT